MPATIRVISKFAAVQSRQKCKDVDTTSSGGWSADLSPFRLGPCELYTDGLTMETYVSQNMEVES